MEADIAVAPDRSMRDKVAVRSRWRWRCVALGGNRVVQHERSGRFRHESLYRLLLLSRSCRLPGVAMLVVVSAKEIRGDLAAGHQFVDHAMKRQNAAAEKKSNRQQERDSHSRQPCDGYDGSIHDVR